MSEIKNVSTIHEEKVDINRNQIEHRATWMGLTYTEGVKAGVDMEPISRAAISKTGLVHGGNFKAMCADPNSMADFSKAFLPELGLKTFEMDVVKNDDKNINIEFHYCPLVAAWKKLGFDDATCAKLCDIAMDGDRNIAEGMGLGFNLGKTIANGDNVCEIHFFKK